MNFEVGKPFIGLEDDVEATRRPIANLCVLYVLVNASETTRQILGMFVSVGKHTSCVFYVYERRLKQLCWQCVLSEGQNNVTFRENDFEDVGSWP